MTNRPDAASAAFVPLTIPGKRIVLRDWRPADLEPLAHWLRPEREWREMDGPYFPRPSEDDVARHLERFRRAAVEHDVPTPRVVLAIADRTADALIGRVSRYWQCESTQWLSLGVGIFDPAQWGKGIGFEALGLWSQYLLDTIPEMPRLDLRTWSGNVRMVRLAERLGFREEARFRDAVVVGGRRHDGVGFGILRKEWSERYPDGFRAAR